MLNKRTKVIIIISAIAIVVLSPILYQVVCWQIYLVDPNIVQHKREAYQKLSSEELIKKLSFWNVWWFDTALDILARRNEKSAVPHIIQLLKSSYKYKRDSAMRALAKMRDPRAIDPLMEIIKKGEKHPDYYMALSTLSEMKYDGAFPYVIKWARREDGYRNGAITMLKEFAKQEVIPVLKEIKDMLKGIKGDDWNVEFAKKEIDEVIKYIKSQQK